MEEFEEALKIRKKLAEENPKVYSSYLADTLHNLASTLQHLALFSDWDIDEYPQVLEKIEKGAKIYNEYADYKQTE